MKTVALFIPFLLVFLLINGCQAQTSQFQWINTYHGANSSQAAAITLHPKGYMLAVGTTNQYKQTDSDILLVATAQNGTKLWEQVLESPDIFEGAKALAITPKGHLIIGGWQENNGLLLCLNNDRTVIWQKVLGSDDARDSCQVKALTYTEDHILVVGRRGKAAWAASLTHEGKVEWEREVKHKNGPSSFHALTLLNNGEILAVGEMAGNFLIVKMNGNGKVRFKDSFGSQGRDIAQAVLEDQRGNWMIAGQTDDFNAGNTDVFLAKLDPKGKPVWERVWGEEEMNETAIALHETAKGYVLAGKSGAGTGIFASDWMGNLMWHEQVTQPAACWPTAMYMHTDSSFAFAGIQQQASDQFAVMAFQRGKTVVKPTPIPQAPFAAVQLLSSQEAPKAFSPVRTFYADGMYHLNARPQELFQLLVNAANTPYLYVFSRDGKGNIHWHYPNPYQLVVDTGGLHHAPIRIPSQKALALTDPEEHLVLLFSKKELPRLQNALKQLPAIEELSEYLAREQGCLVASTISTKYNPLTPGFSSPLSPIDIFPVIFHMRGE